MSLLFKKSNDNPRFLVTFLLNCCHTNPLKTRFKKVLRVSVINNFYTPDIPSTSWRLHSEFVLLLFLQGHRETDLFFVSSGVHLPETKRTIRLPSHGVLLPVVNESSGSVFSGRHVSLNSPIFLCYILYIEQWGFHFIKFQTIVKSALDLDVLNSVRVLFMFRQPVDLLHTLKTVKGMLNEHTKLQTGGVVRVRLYNI